MNDKPQASGLRLKIDFAQASDPGRDPNKQVNEDACGYAETRFGHLAVLCDGMGGHYGGKEASRTAITTIFEVFEQIPMTVPPAHALKVAIEEAGRRVYLLGGPPENRARPGSTVVAMLLHERGLDVAHVGDSRAYIIRSNQIYPLTRDHSMVQGMIDAGMLTEESAMGHPDANKITRALGMRPDVDVELRPEAMALFAGDVLLQSSDGLTDLALGRDILGATRQALASGTADHACNMLVKLANDRGGHDNISVQMVRVLEVAKGDPPQATTPDHGPAPAQGPLPQMTFPGGTPSALAYGSRPDGGPQPTPQALHEGGSSDGGYAPKPPAEGSSDGGYATKPPAEGSSDGGYATKPPAEGSSDGGYATKPPAEGSPHQPGVANGAGASGPTPQAAAEPFNGGAANAPNHLPAATMGETPSPPARPVDPFPLPPPGLAAYRLDPSQTTLALPPPSTRGYGAPPALGAAGTPLPSASPIDATAPGGFTPPPGRFAPPSSHGALATTSRRAAPPSNRTFILIVIGASTALALLLMIVVWAIRSR